MVAPVRHLALALLLLRLGVGLVMAMWTIDKIVNPDHASAVFSNFYGFDAQGPAILMAVGLAQGVVVIAFLVGAMRTLSYGAILAMHAISTLASWRQYLDAFENLLFFAAWPMLAACVALFLLRRHDTLLTLDAWLGRSPPGGS
ncbi:hypothetical protein [Brevundimonas sp.]|uniref:hypothetical protein n=1 Tax=Brevundimonas sp. TaxID=1871086 RepID=UPI003F72CC69